MGSFNPFTPVFQPPYGIPRPSTVPPEIGYSTFTCEKPDDEKLPHELYPYTFPPPTFQSFRPTGWADATVISATPVVLVTYTMPTGSDGIILKIAHGFNGPGFTEGSGELTWNLSINGNQPVPDFGEMLSSIGDYKHAEDISPGFILKSGQSLVYSVTNVSLITAGTKCFGVISGYRWRIQTGKVGST